MKRVGIAISLGAFFALGMVAFVGAALAQQGAGDDQFEVTITDSSLQLSPSTVDLTINSPFTVVVRNEGTATYSLVLEEAGAINQPLSVAGATSRIDDIAPGDVETETWTVETAGDYQLAAYTDTAATTASDLVVTLTVGTGDVGAAAATEVATSTAAATGTSTPEATGTAAATATAEATSTSAATATSEAGTAAATGTIEATEVAAGTAEATLPQTGGTDDSLPMSIALIVFGALLAVGGLLVGRKLAGR